MGESHQLTTRREILKRGAIVGGGVLWITPVVQTLGMSTAVAADVSGDRSCAIMLKFVDCFFIGLLGTYVGFEAFVPARCACNPLGDGYRVELFIDGINPRSSTMDADSNVPGRYTKHVFVAAEVDHVTARCVMGDGDSLQVYSTSNLITWTWELERNCRIG